MAVITRIKETIFTQKFEGASADLLNANIIARDLGLADKKDITSDGDKITYNAIWGTVDPILADGNSKDHGIG